MGPVRPRIQRNIDQQKQQGDEKLIDELADNYDLLVTLENHVVAGGAGSAIAEYLDSKDKNHKQAVQLFHLGLPDYFIEHATQQQQYQEAGLDVESIVGQVQKLRGQP